MGNKIKVGDRVNTPDGNGERIGNIGKPPINGQLLICLDKTIKGYCNFYYSPNELKIIKQKI